MEAIPLKNVSAIALEELSKNIDDVHNSGRKFRTSKRSFVIMLFIIFGFIVGTDFSASIMQLWRNSLNTDIVHNETSKEL